MSQKAYTDALTAPRLEGSVRDTIISEVSDGPRSLCHWDTGSNAKPFNEGPSR